MEFLFIVAYQPWALPIWYQYGRVGRSTRLPVYRLSRLSIPFPMFSAEGSISAYGIATKFTFLRAVLLLAIAIIQSPTLLVFALNLCEIHFIIVLQVDFVAGIA